MPSFDTFSILKRCKEISQNVENVIQNLSNLDNKSNDTLNKVNGLNSRLTDARAKLLDNLTHWNSARAGYLDQGIKATQNNIMNEIRKQTGGSFYMPASSFPVTILNAEYTNSNVQNWIYLGSWIPRCTGRVRFRTRLKSNYTGHYSSNTKAAFIKDPNYNYIDKPIGSVSTSLSNETVIGSNPNQYNSYVQMDKDVWVVKDEALAFFLMPAYDGSSAHTASCNLIQAGYTERFY